MICQDAGARLCHNNFTIEMTKDKQETQTSRSDFFTSSSSNSQSNSQNTYNDQEK